MKSKLLILGVLVLVLVLVLQVVSLAWDPPPPCTPTPPPPEPATCSPGFWKNHTELWYGDPQWADAEWMLAALEARGNQRDLFAHRFEVADWLNGAYPDAPCDD